MSSRAANLAIGKSIREIRFYFCQSAPGSAGIRQFISNHYWNMKNANPEVSIMVRECDGIMPKFVARNGILFSVIINAIEFISKSLDVGAEQSIEVPAMTLEQIMEVFRRQTQA